MMGFLPPLKGRPRFGFRFFGLTIIDPALHLWFNHKIGPVESCNFPPALTGNME